MKDKVFGWIVVVFGVAVSVYGLIGIGRYGFYISGRWSVGQTEGGLAPLFLLIGLLAIAYGVFDLKLKAKKPKNSEEAGHFTDEK